jgi:hypothetical protein
MSERIEEGDLVDVFFSDGSCLKNCRVLYTPQATGDSWHLKSEDGKIIYVQQFETMHLIAKGVIK